MKVRQGQKITVPVNVGNWPYYFHISDRTIPAFPNKVRNNDGSISAVAFIVCPDLDPGNYELFVEDKEDRHKAGTITVLP